MPKDMTTFYTGSSDPAEALRSLLEVMQTAHETDLSAEEKLNQIKVTNATWMIAIKYSFLTINFPYFINLPVLAYNILLHFFHILYLYSTFL